MNNIIDLEKYRSSNGKIKSRVFTGRDRGENVRKQSKIDELLDNNDSITIIIPKDIYSITPSFLEGFLKTVVKKFGKEVIKEKINFDSTKYNIETPFNEAIDRILQTYTALES